MKILCTADWRGADITPVIELTKKHQPDLIINAGNWASSTSTKRERQKLGLQVGELRHLAPILGIQGPEDVHRRDDLYATDFDIWQSDELFVMLIPARISSEEIDMTIPMFLKHAKDRISVLVVQGVPSDAEKMYTEFPVDSACKSFDSSLANGWDLCACGGLTIAQVTPIYRVVVPGSIEPAYGEAFMRPRPRKGVTIWEDGNLYVDEFTHVKGDANKAIEELFDV